MTSRYVYAGTNKIKTRWVSPIVRFKRWLRRKEPDVFEVIGYNQPVYPSKNPRV